MSLTSPAQGPGSAPVHPQQDPDAVPFEFESPGAVVRRKDTGGGQHGRQLPREGFESLRRRVHPVDHPVLTLRRKEDEPTLDTLPVENNLDLTSGSTSRIGRSRGPRSRPHPRRTDRKG